MEYYCHLWAGAPSYYLDIFDKLLKQVYRTVGLSLEIIKMLPFLIFFSIYYFGRCSSELAELVLLPYSGRRVIS